MKLYDIVSAMGDAVRLIGNDHGGNHPPGYRFPKGEGRLAVLLHPRPARGRARFRPRGGRSGRGGAGRRARAGRGLLAAAGRRRARGALPHRRDLLRQSRARAEADRHHRHEGQDHLELSYQGHSRDGGLQGRPDRHGLLDDRRDADSGAISQRPIPSISSLCCAAWPTRAWTMWSWRCPRTRWR